MATRISNGNENLEKVEFLAQADTDRADAFEAEALHFCLYNMSGLIYNYRRLVKMTLMPDNRIADVVRLVKKAGILRPRDLNGHGIPRVYLRMAVDEGAITRVGPGLYVARGERPTEHHSLAQASKRVPHGVV